MNLENCITHGWSVQSTAQIHEAIEHLKPSRRLSSICSRIFNTIKDQFLRPLKSVTKVLSAEKYVGINKDYTTIQYLKLKIEVIIFGHKEKYFAR